MATNISGASLSSIYERLNAASGYHPMEAETFSDWSMEAGDIVTVSRGEEAYQSPVHTTRMVWKGTPQTTISASGKKERESIAKVSQRKYGRGSGAMRNQQELHYEIFSEDGALHSLIDVTASSIRTEVGQTISGMAHSIIEQTATYIRTEVENAASAISASVIEQTAEYVRTEVSSIASGVAWSVVEQTMTGIEQKIGSRARVFISWTDPALSHNDLIDGDLWYKRPNSTTWNELSGMTWNEISEYKWKELYGTEHFVRKNGAWVKVLDTATIVESEVNIEHDREHWAVVARQLDLQGEVYEGNLSVTAQQITSEVNQKEAGLNSKITQTASQIRSEVNDTKNGLQSSITQTASQIRSEVSDTKNGLQSSITQTASQIRSEVSDTKNSLEASITVTASQIRQQVTDTKNSLEASITVTASQIRQQVTDTKNSLEASITVTASQIRQQVTDTKNSLEASITVTASQIRQQVTDTKNSLEASITVTASQIRQQVTDTKNSLEASITVTASQIRQQLTDTKNNLQSSITQTASQIRTEVSDKTSAASIVAGINAQTGSYVAIQANKINLSGYVLATDITSDFINGKIAGITSVGVKNLAASGTISIKENNTYYGIQRSISDLNISLSGNTYTLQYKKWGDQSWSNVSQTFSRAVSSFTWGGGSGKVNVTALPQNQTQSVNISLSGSTTITSNGPYTYKAMYEDGSGDDQEIGGSATKTVTVSVPSNITYVRAYAGGAGTPVAVPPATVQPGYTNNSSGYHIISEGSSGEAGIIVGMELKVNGGSSQYVYDYLESAPTNLYRYAYGKGNTAGQSTGQTTGWNLARGKCDESGSTSTTYLMIHKPGSSYNSQTPVYYYLSVDDDYAYIKNSDQTIRARVENTGYDNGWYAGYDDTSYVTNHGLITVHSGHAAVTSGSVGVNGSYAIWPAFKKYAARNKPASDLTDSDFIWGPKMTVSGPSMTQYGLLCTGKTTDPNGNNTYTFSTGTGKSSPFSVNTPYQFYK